MSFLVTRPARPVPGTVLMSTLCSAALLRTSGVDLRFSRSSVVSAAPLPPPVASPTARLSAIDAAGATAGTARTDGAGAAVSPELRVGFDGAGAGGAAAGVAGFAGAGAVGEDPAGGFFSTAAALASVSIRATTV